MNKNNIFFLVLLLIIIIGIYNRNISEFYSADNINYSDDKHSIFLKIKYDINNDKTIIDRSDDNEYRYILNKTINKLKSYYPNIVLVTSKIIVSNNSLSYISHRSIYTSETRFKQTLETIESVRRYIPNACIFLIDDSDFEKEYIYMSKKLNDICDVFINPLTDTDLHYYTNVNKYKSIAEGYQIMYFLDIFNNLNIKFDRFFKISGRYFINNSFDINKYMTNTIVFSPDLTKGYTYYFTCFYMFPYEKFQLYVDAYKILYINKDNENFIQHEIEFILPMLLKLENITIVNKLGITQRIAVWDIINDI